VLPQWLVNQCSEELILNPGSLPHLLFGASWLTASPLMVAVVTGVDTSSFHLTQREQWDITQDSLMTRNLRKHKTGRLEFILMKGLAQVGRTAGGSL
jgi:hypothetical protein